MKDTKYKSLPSDSSSIMGADVRQSTKSRLQRLRKRIKGYKALSLLLAAILLFTLLHTIHKTNTVSIATKNPPTVDVKANFLSFQLDNIITEDEETDFTGLLTLNSIPKPENEYIVKALLNDKDIIVPDMTDKSTILNLAKIAQNAYVRNPHTGDWQNVTDYDSHDAFGWDEDYIRGHIFKNDLKKFLIISIKGTSSAGLPGTGAEQDTIENDKFNDNLLFSCCCARVSYLWTPVCDCYLDAFTCDQPCLERNIRDNSNYYKSGCQIYRTVASKYPDYTIWVLGHSLGGALSSLVARTYGLVGITFETPGELLASQRLHLPLPDDSSFDNIWHVGNNADPIFMGTCNGASSSCNLAGYAMESNCHSGWQITYDTIKELNWGVDIRKHRIKTVIDKVFSELEVPEAIFSGNGKGDDPCIDCFDWEFVQNTVSATSTQAEPTSTTTRKTTTTLTTALSSSCVGRNFVGWCTSYTTF